MMLRNGKNGGYAVIKRRWIAPGGKTDPGESNIESAIRESKEELGITIHPTDLSVIYEKHDDEFGVDMVFYLCTHWTGSIRAMEPEKFDKMEWVKLVDVKKLDGKDNAHLGVMIADAVNVLIQQQGIKTPPKDESEETPVKSSAAKPVYARW